MADEAFVDAHIHFYDAAAPGLQWAWREPGYRFRKWEASDVFAAPAYLPADFEAEAAPSGVEVIGAVHVHSVDPADDPVAETAWLETVADAWGKPLAIVGSCLLGEPDAVEVIRGHAAHPRFRGVRDPGSPRVLDLDAIGPAMDVLAELGSTVELRRHHDSFKILDDIAARWPEVTVVLSHACLPLERTPPEFAAWSKAMRRLRQRPNVMCKISAVAGGSDPDWTVGSIKPWILTCIDAFGAERTMLGSNFPVERVHAELPRLLDAYRQSLAELPAASRRAVWATTAQRLYDLR